jgi:hypothetical protein
MLLLPVHDPCLNAATAPVLHRIRRCFSTVALAGAACAALAACDSAGLTTPPQDTEPDANAEAKLLITPASHDFEATGEQIRLEVTLRDPDGDPVSATDVAWTTSNPDVATVGADGTVTARSVGAALIRASVGDASATSDIEVLGSSPPPSPSGSREPEGYRPITDRAFDARDDGGWHYNTSSRFTIGTRNDAPRSCCRVGEARFEAGFNGGSSPVTTWTSFGGSGHTEIYISFWLRLSDNWQGHSSGVNKVGFAWIHGDASVYFSAQGGGSGSLRPQIRLQAVPDGARNLDANATSVAIDRGRWHHWEVQLIANSGGNANGVARLWLDGTLVSDHRDIRYSSGSQSRVWEHLYWNPVWGGMGDTVKQDMSMSIDHIYASGR